MKKSNSSSLYHKHVRVKDSALRIFIFVCAAITVFVAAVILLHILIKGVPGITWEFISSTYSSTKSGSKGILPMIINTLYVVLVTLLISTPIGIGCAIYLTQYAKQGKLVKAIRFTTEVLSGIPSIIFRPVWLFLFLHPFQSAIQYFGRMSDDGIMHPSHDYSHHRRSNPGRPDIL